MTEKLPLKTVLQAVEACHGLMSLMAHQLGVSRASVYNYANRHAAVKEAIRQAREAFVDEAEQKLREAVMKGEGWAIALVVKTLGKSRSYVERVETKDLTTPTEIVLSWNDEPQTMLHVQTKNGLNGHGAGEDD